MILLSDGKETSGDANATAFALAKQGYRIDAVYFESTYLDAAEMQISEVELPSDVYAGDTVDIFVTVQSNVAGESGVLVIADNVNRIGALKDILEPACELTVVKGLLRWKDVKEFFGKVKSLNK